MATKPPKKPKSVKAKESNPAAVDAWLAKLPSEQREALQRMREQVQAASRELVETLAYGVPMYYVGTTQVLGFGAFKSHLTIGLGSETIDTLRAELEGFDTTQGTVRFTPERPLPAALVKRLVKTRLALHAASKGE